MTNIGAEVRTERSSELRQHLGHLDALRGIAVLGVVLVHTGILCPSRFDELTWAGRHGVQLFFVVSAFTIMLTAEARRSEPWPMASFFLRRFFRLAPLYYLVLIITPLTIFPLRTDILGTTLAIAFLQNVSLHYIGAGARGGWSLGNESLFYCAVPLLLRYVSRLKSSVVAFTAVLAVSLVVTRVLLFYFPGLFEYLTFYSFLAEAPVFMMGVMTYFIWKQHLRALENSSLAKPLSAVFLLLAVALTVATYPLDELKLTESSAAFALLLAGVSLHPWKVLVNHATIFLGKISYSIYLTHFFFLYVALPWMRDHGWWWPARSSRPVLHLAVTFLTTLICSVLVSTVTWLLVEEPGIRLGRRIVRAVQGRPRSGSGQPPLFVPAQAVLEERTSSDAQF